MTTERDKAFYVERRGKKPLPDEAQGYPYTVGLTIVHRVVIFIHHDSASSKESESRGSHLVLTVVLISPFALQETRHGLETVFRVTTEELLLAASEGAGGLSPTPSNTSGNYQVKNAGSAEGDKPCVKVTENEYIFNVS